MARLVDGAPAIIQRKHGKGQAILFATHLDMAFWEIRDPALRQLFENLMRSCGVHKDILIASPQLDYARQRVDPHLLSHGDQHAILINNQGDQPVDLTVTVPSAPSVQRATELFTNADVTLTRNEGAQFSIHIPPEDGAIVMLE
jgi:hypothetical protein